MLEISEKHIKRLLKVLNDELNMIKDAKDKFCVACNIMNMKLSDNVKAEYNKAVNEIDYDIAEVEDLIRILENKNEKFRKS